MESASPLKRSHLGSALAGQSMIRPTGGRGGRSMVAGLMLTSLVDAFSILVIFLIMNTANNQDVVNLGKKITLPTIAESGFIEQGVTVRIEDGKFVVEEKTVALPELVATLKALNGSVEEGRRENLVIVADRNLDYNELSPVILAGSQSGYTKFKFAVIRK